MSPRRIVPVMLLTALTALVVSSPRVTDTSDASVVVQWNAAALEASRRSTLGPPAIARPLAIVHTCMYDAWAAYDPIAAGVHYLEKYPFPATEDQQARAISYAAHRALVDLFPAQRPLFDALMAQFGYDAGDVSDPDSTRGD